LGVGLAACTSPGHSTASTTTSAPAQSTTTSSPTGGGTHADGTPVSTSVPIGQFVPATSPVFEFYSPSHNISCEIDYVVTNAANGSAYCTTGTPTRSVVMATDGSLKTCDGEMCGSNAGVGTPTLAYGNSTGVGPFLCTSTVQAMVCTVTGGKGFSISRSGITPIGG
jgi:hypothetical protein